MSGMDETTKEFLAQKWDLNLVYISMSRILGTSNWHQKREVKCRSWTRASTSCSPNSIPVIGRPARVKPLIRKLPISFVRQCGAIITLTQFSHVADMDERQWGVVMRNNDILSGKFFAGGDTNSKLATPTSVSRARYTGMSRLGSISSHPGGRVSAKLI